MKHNHIILSIITIAVILFLIQYGSIGQDETYHHFADNNPFVGVSNFYNVLSNIFFVIVGVGALIISRLKNIRLILPETILLLGIALTGLGSAYYHYNPDNLTLIWDRLPMTIVFTAFFYLIFQKFVLRQESLLLFFIFLGVGIYGIVHWIIFNDLRVYAFVQYFPILAIICILILYKVPFSYSKYILLIILFYAIAKLFEHFDLLFFQKIHVSGHTIKHVFASISTVNIYAFIKALKQKI